MNAAEELNLYREYAEIRYCKWCDKPFATAINQRQRYCSTRCKNNGTQADLKVRRAKN